MPSLNNLDLSRCGIDDDAGPGIGFEQNTSLEISSEGRNNLDERGYMLAKSLPNIKDCSESTSRRMWISPDHPTVAGGRATNSRRPTCVRAAVILPKFQS
jgi:hypothetical protein